MSTLLCIEGEQSAPLSQWGRMTATERMKTVKAMHAKGGIFVSALGGAWLVADPVRSCKLAEAFPDFVRQYGPGSDAYVAMWGAE